MAEKQAAEKKQRRGGSLGFIVGFAIGIPATIFALSNLEGTTVEFLGWEAEVPLWLVIAISVLAGAIIGMGVLLEWQRRRRRGRRRKAIEQPPEPDEGGPVAEIEASGDPGVAEEGSGPSEERTP